MKRIKEFLKLIKIELALCVAAPIAAALLLDMGRIRNGSYVYMILIGFSCVFIYGLVKMFFKTKTLLEMHAIDGEDKYKSKKYRIFIIVIAVICPISGLMLNSYFANGFFRTGFGLLGNFSCIWFYALAVFNGLVMLLDTYVEKRSPALLYLKVVGFTFITYFTIVFIPYMPLGFIGILFFGLGALVFVPAAIWITEFFQIARDIKFFREKRKAAMTAAIILGAITIPSVMAASFHAERINYANAMSYITGVGAAKSPRVDLGGLNRTIANIENMSGNYGFRFSLLSNNANTPIISRLYKIAVLDDKRPSPETVDRLKALFSNEPADTRAIIKPLEVAAAGSKDVKIVGADTRGEYDAEAGAYQTWVDLELKYEGSGQLGEFITEFKLPDGCFVSDYYLYVGNERKQGILADKRAALTIYERIVRASKDPGIIYYKNDDTIELRVFPFNAHEVRRTGFRVLHSQNETISLNGTDVRLEAEKNIAEPVDMSGFSFIPAAAKKSLPACERQPKYYFVIDAGIDSPYSEHVRKIADYSAKHGISDYEVYAASYKLYNVADDKIKVKCEGGFNLPLAMKMIASKNENADRQFPVIISVSDNIYKAPSFSKVNFAKMFPESGHYYNLEYNLSLTPYSLVSDERQNAVETPIIGKALLYGGLAVADDDRSEIAVRFNAGGNEDASAIPDTEYTDNAYLNAMILYGKCLMEANREFTNHNVQIDLVRDSFRQRILTKYTAYTVLETAEQEKALFDLQERILNGKDDDSYTLNRPVNMDEPGILLIAVASIILFMLYFIRDRRRRRHAAS